MILKLKNEKILMNEKEIEDELYQKLEKWEKAKKALEILEKDAQVNALTEMANVVTMFRSSMNDHGKMHSKIVSLNAIKIYEILKSKNISGNLEKEGLASEDEERAALLIGAYLHDIGNSISRDNHELLSVILAKPIVEDILSKIGIRNPNKVESTILEEILCHMGNYSSSALESKIVACADGTDMTKGRARIPYKTGKMDIHSFSATAINEVNILPGEKKPVKIKIEMDDSAGIFQIEEILNKKIKNVGFEQYVEVIAIVKNEKEVRYFSNNTE